MPLQLRQQHLSGVCVCVCVRARARACACGESDRDGTPGGSGREEGREGGEGERGRHSRKGGREGEREGGGKGKKERKRTTINDRQNIYILSIFTPLAAPCRCDVQSRGQDQARCRAASAARAVALVGPPCSLPLYPPPPGKGMWVGVCMGGARSGRRDRRGRSVHPLRATSAREMAAGNAH